MADQREDLRVANMGLSRTAFLGLIPVPSAASIMEELPGAFPLAGSRALAEASMVVEDSTEAEGFMAEAVAGNRVPLTMRLMTWRTNYAHK